MRLNAERETQNVKRWPSRIQSFHIHWKIPDEEKNIISAATCV